MSATVAPATLPQPYLTRRFYATRHTREAWTRVAIGLMAVGSLASAGSALARLCGTTPHGLALLAGVLGPGAMLLGLLLSAGLFEAASPRRERKWRRARPSATTLEDAYRFLQEGDTATYLTAATRASLTSAYLAAHAVEADAIAADRCEAKGKPVGSEGRAAQSLARQLGGLLADAQRTRAARIAGAEPAGA